MSGSFQFYIAQAEQSAQAAAATDLPNVKDRCLRAEAAWRLMAARLERTDENRKQSAVEKMARALVAE